MMRQNFQRAWLAWLLLYFELAERL